MTQVKNVILHTDSLDISYEHNAKNPKNILENVNLTLLEGEIVSLVGASGSGKSTLLRALAGLIPPTNGHVQYANLGIAQPHKDMSMVFQFGALLDSLTIKENVALAFYSNDKYDSKEIYEKVDYSLNLVGLPGIGNLMPSEISGGMKKRVGIARAIVTNPKCILYDEPTTGLDPINTDKINQLIGKISSSKIASVFVTHEIKTVFNVANKVVMLHDGSIIFSGSPDDLRNTKDKFIKYFVSGKK